MPALRPQSNQLVKSGISPADERPQSRLVGLGRSTKSYRDPRMPAADADVNDGDQPVPIMLKGAGSAAPVVLLGIYLFLLSSQANQFLASYAHISIPFVAAAFYLLCLAYLVSGNAARFVSSPFMAPWTAMFLWWTVTAFTGIFPGRSVPFILKDYGLRIHLLPFIICAICENFDQIRKVMVGVALGLGVVLFFCFTAGVMDQGRFFIPETALSNGNDLAMHLVLFGCLAISMLAGGKGANLFLKLAIPVALYFVLKTGSRSNMLTVMLLMAVGFFMLPAKQKLIMVGLAVILPIMIVPLLPSETKSRLGSFFSASEGAKSEQEALQDSMAVDSTNARLDLQWRALQLTGENFVLGIGVQNFVDAVEEMVKRHGGLKSGWQVAHNSYLQVSAETGIPGAIFYIWNVALCLRLNIRTFRHFRNAGNPKKSKNAKLARTPFLVAFALLAACSTYAFGVFFTTIPYDFQLAMLVGLTAAMDLALKSLTAPKAPKPVAGYGMQKKSSFVPLGPPAPMPMPLGR